MNTSALKTFAPAVRRHLMEAVTRKLDFVLSAQTPDYLTTFAPQVAALRTLAEKDRDGLIERVAYTWFNRFTALRYLDARDWHPFRARVLTPSSSAETQPELLRLTRNGSLPEELRRHTDPDRLNDLLDSRIPTAIPDADPQGEVYRHLVLAACRFYYSLLPDLFEKLDDETELLLPDDLLTEHSVVHGFRTEITDEDCVEVELIGWLYQFYIAEKKDAVMARKSAVPTADIPAVTQLFTPHWIVRYLVDNSLGRLWLLNRPGSRLREQMPYYVEGEAETDFLKVTKPEQIRVLDPAVGSGHMLTYAFDLLYAIYEEEGYAPSEIAGLILTHNLYGVDIDQRAGQLASMALVLKAREKSRRFFQSDQMVLPHIIALQDVSFEEGELHEYIRALKLEDLFDEAVLQLMPQFEHSTTFGSFIQPCLDERAIAQVRRAIEAKDLGGQLFLRETHLKVLRVLEQAEALTQRYQVVLANPPYMGKAQMIGGVKEFLKRSFPDSKADLFAVFIERGLTLCRPAGFAGLVTMQSWMFLSSYEKLRAKLIENQTLISMAHLGPRAFDTIGGEVVQTTAFVFGNIPQPKFRGTFIRLVDGGCESEKATAAREAISNPGCGWAHKVDTSAFRKIPGSPIAYWVSKGVLSLFERCPPLGTLANARVGLLTSDNALFLRLWWEVPTHNVLFTASSSAEAQESGRRWFPHNKGGGFRRWWGNQDFVVDWENNGERIKTLVVEKYPYLNGDPNFVVHDDGYYFSPFVSWSEIGTSDLAFRSFPKGFTSNIKGMSAFPSVDCSTEQLLALCNSAFASYVARLLNPTVSFGVGGFDSIPAALLDHTVAAPIVTELVEIAKADWDNFETSWDFRDQSLLRPGLKGATLEASWRNWEAQRTAAICRMQELETENNRLFIAAYGLDGELQPEVPEGQITLARAEASRDMAAFLSYAVGCMMGRYSLDQPGLILGDAGDTLPKYLAKIGKPLDQVAFAPDDDGIIPALDGEWFEDDIVSRTREFLRTTFGDETLRENVRFIEESLGKDLRRYFLTEFYKNHISNERAYGYKKRPIYWLVQSPRKGFSVLIYLHRYTRDTMNLVLNRYFRPYQEKLRNRLDHLSQVQASDAASARDKTAARKEADKLTKTLHECEEWERDVVLPLAQARIELDLDDGVKINYQKLGEALAPIAGLGAVED